MPVTRIQDLEGEVTFDHRDSPGMAPELMIAQGLPPEAGRGLYKGPFYTCGHCQRTVFVNSLRTRQREVCKGCMHVICDGCGKDMAKTGQCVPFEARVAQLLKVRGG